MISSVEYLTNPTTLPSTMNQKTSGRYVIILSHDASTHNATDGAVLSSSEAAERSQQCREHTWITAERLEHEFDFFTIIFLG